MIVMISWAVSKKSRSGLSVIWLVIMGFRNPGRLDHLCGWGGETWFQSEFAIRTSGGNSEGTQKPYNRENETHDQLLAHFRGELRGLFGIDSSVAMFLVGRSSIQSLRPEISIHSYFDPSSFESMKSSGTLANALPVQGGIIRHAIGELVSGADG